MSRVTPEETPEEHARAALFLRGKVFGNPLDLATRTVHMARRVQVEFPNTSDYVLIVAESSHKVTVGDSNGNQLLAIVRSGRINTFLLRRSTQSRLCGLPYFKEG